MNSPAKSSKNKNDKTRPDSYAVIRYHKSAKLESEVASELGRVMSSALQVEQEPGEFAGSTLFIPWLEIALVFASTTIATSVLSKIGEDLYNHFKGKVVKTFDEARAKRSREVSDEIETDGLPEFMSKASSERFIIKIEIGEMLISGTVTSKNSKILFEALKSAQKMITDASQQLDTGLKCAHKGPLASLDKSLIPITELPSELRKVVLRYKYVASRKQWVLEDFLDLR